MNLEVMIQHRFKIEEAEIVIELLHKINDAYLENKYFDPNVNKQDNIDERRVWYYLYLWRSSQIDQAKAKGIKFQSFNEKSDSKLIISTVDDFQGDERDIIIVSMVRNPQNPEKVIQGLLMLIKVNVAFSRLRRLLIIVGNKDYLVNKGSN